MENDEDNSVFFRRRTDYDWDSTIMVAAIISLSFVVILVTILYIYARCILRRQARRQAALHHLTIITGLATTEPPRRGLDPSVIASLPIFVIKQPSTGYTNEMGPMECSVCLSLLEDGEMGRTLPNCKHTFHAECVDKWFVSNSTCPVCRTEAEPGESVAVVVEATPSAPPAEGTLDGGGFSQPSPKVSGSSSRLSSFKRILSRERSSKRMQTQSCAQEDGLSDVERQ
ncbi:hypothetical protein BUALT_Bualt03G0189500 [Buddleja alternifolia]|uniref:RING-type E3 ubiquitin transferase n=1 Tax=Buddleja alternifolia TaxID=168488 RepID=A0AAV6XUZ6_9LAMI|nr:hypothetical protein BUALT_Bualt03G0189500 [Buddleja alternifolia]